MNGPELDRPSQPPTPARLSPANATHHCAEYKRLLARYRQLSWCTSADEQRERTALQQPLMELYRILHPATASGHLDDDFDTVMRGRRRA